MIRVLAALAALVPFLAAAQPIEPTVLGGSPDARTRLDELAGDLEPRFRAALARYDAEIAAQPHRIRAQIARCEFVEWFPSEYEYATFSDDVYELGAECEEDLLMRFPDHPEVRLWQLGRVYNDAEALEMGDALYRVADIYRWTNGQRSRLLTALANFSERLDTEGRFRERTAEYARRALEADVRADVRLILASYFQKTGDREAALEALTSPFDGHDPKDNWYAVRKMAYLADLGARDAVLALHAKLDGETYYDRNEAAAALRGIGELELAQRELESGTNYYGTDDERQRFALALESGDAAAAHAAYESMRDAGFLEDPIGVNRFALFVAYPDLPWRARDLLGWLGALGFLALILLGSFVPLALVHYRGLVNRLRGATWLSADQVGLRDAWLGLVAFNVAGLVAMYTIGPFDFLAEPTVPLGIAAEPSQLAELLVNESVLSILLLLAVAYALRRKFEGWWGTDWSVAKCVLVGALGGLVLRVPLFGMMASGFDLDAALRVDNAMWQMLESVEQVFGPAAALWVLAVAAPVGEELLFRGLLLRASLRHISFPVANGLQALLFAAMHLDLAAMPFLFGFGLAAGWLARQSGGLLAPMVMHAVFNLVVGLLIIN